MNYQILWSPELLRDFTAKWETLPKDQQREAMDALEGMDRMLMNSPTLTGESRESATKRLLIHPPLTIAFRVDLRLQVVRIVGARIRTKS